MVTFAEWKDTASLLITNYGVLHTYKQNFLPVFLYLLVELLQKTVDDHQTFLVSLEPA